MEIKSTGSRIGVQRLNTSTPELRKFWFRLEFAGLAIKCGIIPKYEQCTIQSTVESKTQKH